MALGGGLAFASGIASLFSGQPSEWPVFAFHGAAGLWLLLLALPKLRRVWPRIAHSHLWDRRTILGLLVTAVLLVTGSSGVAWVAGADLNLAGFNLLNWHIAFGFALSLLVVLHMFARAHPLRGRDLHGRRQMLRFGALALAAAVLWPSQQIAERALALRGARRRFTGSQEAGSFAGNAFPSTSWVADQPRPLDPETWRLELDGAVAQPLILTYSELLATDDELEATLDCTSGFYSTQHWRGARVGLLLERAGPLPKAAWVSFISVTTYRWSLPIDEAAGALLATHVAEEPLAHAHGAPVRLVAPGRRGFEWVKWVVRLEVRTDPDPGELVAIHTSSFTPEGRGER
jgi:DMSO/TMAO reductase YedYZ molybdopterin-dependent catalytic subunit